MSKLVEASTMSMPPLSRASIEAAAEAFLQQVAPDHLDSPGRLDVAGLVDHVLPKYGIHFYPDELVDSEAYTDPAGEGHIEIVMAVEQYDALTATGGASHRPRTTACHELGHAFLHVKVIRRRRKLSPHLAAHALQRVPQRQVKAYNCAEWQAWEFASSILMPLRTLSSLKHRSVADIADIYGVSQQFAEFRLKKVGFR